MNEEVSLYRQAWHSGLGRRLAAMTTAWLGLGLLLGASIGLRQGGGLTAFACHLVAGMTVCLVPGICLGLFSGRGKQAFLCGLGGMASGAALSPLQGTLTAAELAELGLVGGAVAGVTLVPYLCGLVSLVKLAVSIVGKRRVTS